MNLKHGDIYLIEFEPSRGNEFKKMRPALVISSNELIKRSNLITCIPFTGNTGNFLEKDDIKVKKDELNNLFTDSVLKVQHISTFDKKRVIKRVGSLDNKTLLSLKSKIMRNFKLN
jgi:mRNA interferase MazF